MIIISPFLRNIIDIDCRCECHVTLNDFSLCSMIALNVIDFLAYLCLIFFQRQFIDFSLLVTSWFLVCRSLFYFSRFHLLSSTDYCWTFIFFFVFPFCVVIISSHVAGTNSLGNNKNLIIIIYSFIFHWIDFVILLPRVLIRCPRVFLFVNFSHTYSFDLVFYFFLVL